MYSSHISPEQALQSRRVVQTVNRANDFPNNCYHKQQHKENATVPKLQTVRTSPFPEVDAAAVVGGSSVGPDVREVVRHWGPLPLSVRRLPVGISPRDVASSNLASSIAFSNATWTATDSRRVLKRNKTKEIKQTKKQNKTTE